ncbi:DUF6624 domain-containing protein [Brevundimonas sp. Root1279]|uniref:DUF6624 domain-containing protein n=1 Tax=Brevundimonas sp. Root1279 TaxID=1736443 RepID=UPI0006FEAFE0|nr:DUF6624 domain-containing protein [Brevundimonas sp. Root1279]KQW86581.1 hypothetical protein ASC65_01415 [Brevundimonas sp. Root1279]
MVRFATVAVAALLMAFQSAPPGPPQLTPELLVLTEDAEAARTFDYWALRGEGANLGALSDAVYMRAQVDADTRRCLTEAESVLQAELAAAAAAPDAATLNADRAAAEAAWGRWVAFGDHVLGGAQIAEPPFSYVAERVRLAGAATDPRSRELLSRAARDQLIRRGWEAGAAVWSNAPSPGARARFEARLSRQMCETDAENTSWLRADLAAHGWYRISTYGEGPSKAAWLMTQHADNDRAFQREVLALLEPLAVEKEVEPADVAYLYDRIAVGTGRPQRYGSQGRCVAANVWGPQPLEDESRVDALRASVDLGPLADYAAHMNRWCADFTG